MLVNILPESVSWDNVLSGDFAYFKRKVITFCVLDRVNIADPTQVSGGYQVPCSGGLAVRPPWLCSGNVAIDIRANGESTAPVRIPVRGDPTVTDSHLFVAGGGGGVAIHTITDAVPATEIARLPTIALATDLVPRGDVVYVADEGDVDILDVSNVQDPKFAGRFPFEYAVFTRGMLIDGNHVYVASSMGTYMENDPTRYPGLDIFDVTDPFLPERRGHARASLAGSLAKSGDVVWTVSEHPDGTPWYVSPYSVTDPAAPVALPFTLPGISVAMDGSLALVGLGGPAAVFDASDPAAPVELATAREGTSMSYGVALNGTAGYISVRVQLGDGTYEYWLDVYDLSQPTAPLHVARLPTVGTAFRIKRQGSLLFVPMYSRRTVDVYDVTDPLSPRLVDRLVTEEPPTAAVDTGSHYLVTHDNGLYVYARPTPAVCGNGCREVGERCDDGNRDEGDDCPSDCEASFPRCATDLACCSALGPETFPQTLSAASERNCLSWCRTSAHFRSAWRRTCVVVEYSGYDSERACRVLCRRARAAFRAGGRPLSGNIIHVLEKRGFPTRVVVGNRPAREVMAHNAAPGET